VAHASTRPSRNPSYKHKSVFVPFSIFSFQFNLDGALIPLRMPKNNNKKAKGKDKGASKKVDAPATDADDNLDDILAEVLAGDLQHLSFGGGNAPAITADTNASSNAGHADARANEVSVPKVTINDAVRRGDTAQLKRWGRRGIRANGVTSLLTAVRTGARDAVFKILVQDLGADVNQADENSYTSLMLAAALARLHAMRCLVVELGADVDQGNDKLFLVCVHGRLCRESCSFAVSG
jgi:hypothetical protein